MLFACGHLDLVGLAAAAVITSGEKASPTQTRRKIHPRPAQPSLLNQHTSTTTPIDTPHASSRAAVTSYRYAASHIIHAFARPHPCPPVFRSARTHPLTPQTASTLPVLPLPSATPLFAAPQEDPSSWHNYGRRPTFLPRLPQPADRFSIVPTAFPCVEKTYYDSCLSLESELPVFIP